MQIPKTYWTEASKAVEQLAFAAESYGLDEWTTKRQKKRWKHDVGIMLMHDDLTAIRLELIAADDSVLAEFKVEFGGRPSRQRHADPAEGVELPLVDQSRVSRHRVIVSRNRREPDYKQFLKYGWGDAKRLRKRDGVTYDSDHAKKITGGRQSGRFHVSDEDRHDLVITRTGTDGYAFARDRDLGADGIFLHRSKSSADFEVGDHVTAIIIQTPKGLQGRAIRPAA